VTIVGNTLLRNDQAETGAGEFQIQYHAAANMFANNIVHAGPGGVLVHAFTGDTLTPAVLDHNLYWSDAGAAGSSWTWRGTEYGSLSAYISGSSQDAHSPFADPRFLDLLAPDLRVAIGSPAIDAGDDPGNGLAGAVDFGGNSRVNGAAIDMGAYEH